MTDKPENPSAFPLSWRSDSYEVPGMTLRDYFAGKALPGVIRTCYGDSAIREIGAPAHFANIAYEVADAMLAARVA